MDPITTAIVSALADLSVSAVKDAYTGLKSLLIHRFGPRSKVVVAVDGLESQPASQGRQLVLAEEIAATRAPEDADLLRTAAALLSAIEANGGSTVSVQQFVQGDRNAVSGTGNVTVHHHA
jgi:hypothetical protein